GVVCPERDAAARVRCDGARPAAGGEVLEEKVAEVAEDDLRAAVRVLREKSFDLGIHVAGGVEEIGPAVVVEVGRSRSPLDETVLNAEARGHCHVLELAAPEVVVEGGN